MKVLALPAALRRAFSFLARSSRLWLHARAPSVAATAAIAAMVFKRQFEATGAPSRTWARSAILVASEACGARRAYSR